MPGEDFDKKAVEDIETYAAADSHRALDEGETPVAMTGFNAVLPQTVQIGAVYTPPLDRSRGLARRAVTLHLHEAKQRGVTDLVLCAASPQVCKEYEAIGFARTVNYTVLVYEYPQVIYG